MSKRPSRDEVTEGLLRVGVLLARHAAAIANLAVTVAETALVMHRLNMALRLADRREEDAVLFQHPDVIDLDMADAYWRPEETP